MPPFYDDRLWTFDTIPARRHAYTGVRLQLDWSLDMSAISRGYDPGMWPALRMWRLYLDGYLSRIAKARDLPFGVVPVVWSVTGDADGPWTETVPAPKFPRPQKPGSDFLAHHTWPRDVSTGRKLNWLTLPVAHYEWSMRRPDPGGFVQEVLDWHPAPLQATVDVRALAGAAGVYFPDNFA